MGNLSADDVPTLASAWNIQGGTLTRLVTSKDLPKHSSNLMHTALVITDPVYDTELAVFLPTDNNE